MEYRNEVACFVADIPSDSGMSPIRKVAACDPTGKALRDFVDRLSDEASDIILQFGNADVGKRGEEIIGKAMSRVSHCIEEMAVAMSGPVVEQCTQQLRATKNNLMELLLRADEREAEMRIAAGSALISQVAAAGAGCGDLAWPGVRPQRASGSASCCSSTRRRVEALRAEAATASDYEITARAREDRCDREALELAAVEQRERQRVASERIRTRTVGTTRAEQAMIASATEYETAVESRRPEQQQRVQRTQTILGTATIEERRRSSSSSDYDTSAEARPLSARAQQLQAAADLAAAEDRIRRREMAHVAAEQRLWRIQQQADDEAVELRARLRDQELADRAAEERARLRDQELAGRAAEERARLRDQELADRAAEERARLREQQLADEADERLRHREYEAAAARTKLRNGTAQADRYS